MKKISLILTLLLAVATVFAQVPQKINYQAVARSNGLPLIGQSIAVRFIIHDQQSLGTILYQEHFTSVLTNAYGLFMEQIGTGIVETGNFNSITWSSGPKYLEVAVDPSNGSNYTSLGSNELVSVPYALYANKADSATYAPQTVYTSGTGINITGSQIVNTAPDQTVTIAGQRGTTVAGTYPNFNIGSPDSLILTAGYGIVITGIYPNLTIAAVDLTPAGTIVAFGGTIPPAGWLLCDGGSYPNATYLALSNVIGSNFGGSGTSFNVPDLRGRFLRGADGSVANNVGVTANNDPDHGTRTAMNTNGQTGNNVGSVETDAFQGHYHSNLSIGVGNGQVGVGVTSLYYGSPSNGFGNSTLGTATIMSPVTDGANGAPRTTSETRPKNAYVNYIIKY